MHKIIGCILIILGTTGAGFSKSRELQNHLMELEELNKIFYLLKSEMEYTRAPLAEIFTKISQKTGEPFQNWLRKLSEKLYEKQGGRLWEIWSNSIEEDLRGSRLKEEEIRDLIQVGRNLEYIENLKLYVEQLEYRIAHTRESYRTKRKLCQSLGIMSGIFLVILLL